MALRNLFSPRYRLLLLALVPILRPTIMLGKLDAAAVTDNKYQSLREIDLHLREKLGLPDNSVDRSIDSLFSPGSSQKCPH